MITVVEFPCDSPWSSDWRVRRGVQLSQRGVKFGPPSTASDIGVGQLVGRRRRRSRAEEVFCLEREHHPTEPFSNRGCRQSPSLIGSSGRHPVESSGSIFGLGSHTR